MWFVYLVLLILVVIVITFTAIHVLRKQYAPAACGVFCDIMSLLLGYTVLVSILVNVLFESLS